MKRSQIINAVDALFNSSRPEANSGHAIGSLLKQVVEYVESLRQPFTSIKKIDQYLAEVNYNDLDYKFAKEYLLSKKSIQPSFGCSSVRSGNFYGRNLDWLYSDSVDFVVRTPNANGRYATIGVAGGIDQLTKSFVDSGKNSASLYKILPFYMQDGINEHHVFCNVNVVPIEKGNTTYSIPTEDRREILSSTMVVRYILDNFSSATEAVEYIKKHVSIYYTDTIHGLGYETHYMVGDTDKTYIMEIINNHVEYFEGSIMTNYHQSGVLYNQDGKVYTPATVAAGSNLPTVINKITPHGSGLERYNLIVSSIETANTKSAMRALMNALLFSNAYNDGSGWWSEFVGNYGIGRDVTIDTPFTSALFQEVFNKARERFLNRDRSKPQTWHTTHSSVYDINALKMYVVSQEETEKEYQFRMKEYYTADEIDAMLNQEQ